MHSPHGRLDRERRVGLFVDYDRLRNALADTPSVSALDVPRLLRRLAEAHGRVIVATAYGDFTADAEVASELQRQHIEPRLALAGSTELGLSLDAQETLHIGPHLDTYILVTDDRSLSDIIQRLHRADRAVTLVASASEATPEAFGGEDQFLSVDDVLSGELRPPARPAADGASGGGKIDFASFDWAPFIKLLDDLEQGMPFVGFGWLLKKKLNAENCGCSTLQDKQELMDRAVDDGVLTLYKVDNIEEGADPVTACKLNRENTQVAALVDG